MLTDDPSYTLQVLYFNSVAGGYEVGEGDEVSERSLLDLHESFPNPLMRRKETCKDPQEYRSAHPWCEICKSAYGTACPLR